MPDRRLVAVLTVAVAALAGCGGGGADKPAAKGATTTQSGDTITIVDFKFDPTPLKVKAGTKVTVTNKDSAPHTVTGESFDTKELKKDQTVTFTAPAKAGTYSYICDIHQYMKGSLEVS